MIHERVFSESSGLLNEYVVMYEGEVYLLTKYKGNKTKYDYYMRHLVTQEVVCVKSEFAKELIKELK
tara:strand:+ start:922 stop:1122 length:201 start_codon:yes stop_codon:yes gene_type:complete